MSKENFSIMSIEVVFEDGFGIGLEYLGPDSLSPLVKEFFLKVKNKIEEDLNNDCSN